MALARALVTRPAILLLDEPLGALDEKLRLDMQVELLELHRQLGMTFVYITHSQEEALTMSDRVILMRRGRIVQEGPPRALFDRPINRFVADFMGVENILEGALAGAGGRARHGQVGDQRDPRPGGAAAGRARRAARSSVGVRAERMLLGSRQGASAGRDQPLPGRPETTIYKGKYLDQSVETESARSRRGSGTVTSTCRGISSLWWAESDCMIMPQRGPNRRGHARRLRW